MKLSLVHVNSKKKIILSDEMNITLGRGTTSIPNFELDSKLSRQHVQLYFDKINNYFVIRDLGSTNGTYLNLKRLDSDKGYQLRGGDIVSFANQTFEVQKIWDDNRILQNINDPNKNLGIPEINNLNQQFSYSGSTRELIILLIKNLLYSLITIGFYLPYAKVNMRKHIWSYTKFGEDKFYFAGKGWEILRSYFVLITIIILLGFGVFILLKQVGGLGILDLIGFYQVISKKTNLFVIIPVFLLIFGLMFAAFFYYVQFGSLRYLLTRTKLRNLYFNLDKSKRLSFIIKSLIGTFLCFITLGIYFPYFKVNQMTFLWNNSSYGNEKLRFTGSGLDFMMINFKTMIFAILIAILISFVKGILTTFIPGNNTWGILLFIITYGSYFLIHSYYKAHSLNFIFNNLHIQNAKLSSRFTTDDIFRLNFINYILIVCTLGLAFPLVFIRNISFYVQKIEFHGILSFEKIERENMKKGGEMAETLGDIFDFELTW